MMRAYSLPNLAGGGLVFRSVLLAILLIITTAVVIGAVLVRAIGAEAVLAADHRLTDALLPVLAVTLLIIHAGAALAYLAARRVRQPLLWLAEAAERLHRGDLVTPIPQVTEAELAPLAEQLELARSSFHAQLRAAANEDARQRALLAALREPIILTSTDGRVMGFNASAATLFGHLARVYGRPIQELLPFIAIAAPRQAVGPGREATWQGDITDAVGQTLHLEVTRTTLEEGQLSASDVYVVHDISRYVELNRSREQLLYSAAHELRGPLGVLDNALELLAADYGTLSTEEFDQLMRYARGTAARLRTLVEDLLNAGSIQSGRFLIRPQPTELSAICDDAVQTVEPLIQARTQRVERQMPSHETYVLADQRYARQVLSNLLANASNYSAPGEVIQLQAERGNGHVRITVEDHGPGIPTEQQAGLFERFYRVRSGADERGIGLGLAIAKGIIDAHHGRIGVESEPGMGTKVWFTLPAAECPRD